MKSSKTQKGSHKFLKKDFEKNENLELDIAIQQIKAFERKKDKVIVDGCILDNLMNVLWNKEKNSKDINDNFVWQIVMKVKNNICNYDAIFYLPLLEKYPVEVHKNIDINKRLEMANLYEAIMNTYKHHKGSYFPLQDCPAVIEIFGQPKERIAMANLYMDELDKIA